MPYKSYRNKSKKNDFGIINYFHCPLIIILKLLILFLHIGHLELLSFNP